MKKHFLITSLIILVAALAAWQFAYASAEKKPLAVGEVPANQSPDQKDLNTFKVGDLTFSMPHYFTETWGPKGEEAKLRNVYYGQCIKRIDGWCSNQKNMGDPDYARFDVYLHAEKSLEGYGSSTKDSKIAPLVGKIPLEKLAEKMTEEYNNPVNCASPQEMVEQSNNTVSVNEPIIKDGTGCHMAFVYQGILVRMFFNSGNFPREEFPAMVSHVTAFLDKHLISTSTSK